MSIELNAIAFADATSFTALAVRFLDVKVPGTDQTWRDFINAYVADGNPFVAADVPFIAFLNSPVDKVQGYTWGDSIEMSEAAGVEVDLSGLPLEKFIMKQAGIVLIDGADFADSKVSELIGHPDGYVGYEGGSSLFDLDSGSRLPERYRAAPKLPVLLDVDFDVRGLTRWPDHCVMGSEMDKGALPFIALGDFNFGTGSTEDAFQQSILGHEMEHSLVPRPARERTPSFLLDGPSAVGKRDRRLLQLCIDPQLPFLQSGRFPVSK